MHRYVFVMLLIFLPSLYASNLSVLDETPPFREYNDTIDIDSKFTVVHRDFTIIDEFKFGYSLGLAEFAYEGEDFNVDVGISLEDYATTILNLNNFSISLWKDDYSVKAGKFVTKFGVMDYLGHFDVFNPVRVSFYNDLNKNIKEYAQWMLETNIYMENDTKVRLILQRHDNTLKDAYYAGNYLLFSNFIPFFLESADNSDMNLIGRAVLSPLYEGYFRPYGESITRSSYDMLDPSFNHSAFGIDVLLHSEDYTLGAIWVNKYSTLPTLRPPQDIIDSLSIVDSNDKESLIQNYIDQHGADDFFEYFRYNKVGLYFEGALDTLGVRAEVSYADKFAILNELSSNTSFSIGIDHKGFMYNSLELQGNYLSILDKGYYQGILVSKLDPIKFGAVDLNIEHSLYYMRYAGYDYFLSKPSVGLKYKNVEFTLEYYKSSDYEMIGDSLIWLLRMTF